MADDDTAAPDDEDAWWETKVDFRLDASERKAIDLDERLRRLEKLLAGVGKEPVTEADDGDQRASKSTVMISRRLAMRIARFQELQVASGNPRPTLQAVLTAAAEEYLDARLPPLAPKKM